MPQTTKGWTPWSPARLGWLAFHGVSGFPFSCLLRQAYSNATPAGHIIIITIIVIIIIIIIISLHNSATPRRHLKSTLRLKTVKRVFKCCGLNKDEIA